ncbi:MAG TPA: protein kinase [Polyangiaceae bacterium]|nr:protein kinase [Polyangiaceae bacterium]
MTSANNTIARMTTPRRDMWAPLLPLPFPTGAAERALPKPCNLSLLRVHAAAEGAETMGQPPDVYHGPTWASGSVITGTPYVVTCELGHGGMGTVYEVRHVDTGHLFAFKVLSTRVAEHPELVDRVVREAEFLRLLNGAPHVVTVVGSGRLRDERRRPYLVMERLYGDTLYTLLTRRSLPLTDALSYMRQVLWGLAVVHGAGAVHRDVKPGNIFVQRDGTCTLLDFGVMKALCDIGLSPSQFDTAPRALIGTPSYMAPETASRKPIDHRADLFSAGLVLAECLLGFRLLPHLTEDEYLQHLVNEGVPSLELSGGAHLPPEVRALVRRATLYEPEHRFPTAQAFIGEINRVADGLGLRLRPIPPGAHVAPDAQRLSASANHAATTLSASNAGFSSPAANKAPPPLVPSDHTMTAAEAAASSARAGALSPSAPPTPVDSVSPTRVKTPAPVSEADLTPPLQSQQRLRFGALPFGPGSRAQGAASLKPEGHDPGPATTLPLPTPSTTRSLVPKFENALAFFKGVLITPTSGVRDRLGPTEPATDEDEPRPEQPDAAQRPVSTPTRLRQGEPTNSPGGRRARAVRVALVLSLALAFMFTFRRQLEPPLTGLLPSAARSPASGGASEPSPMAPMSAVLTPAVAVPSSAGLTAGQPPSVASATPPAEPPSLVQETVSASPVASVEASRGSAKAQVSAASDGRANQGGSAATAEGRPKRSVSNAEGSSEFGLPRRYNLRPPTPARPSP